jgi:hypothetical protein
MRCSLPRHPRLPQAVQATGMVLVSIVASLCAGSPTRGDAIQYNSAKCSENPGGMIYVAAGHHVYHQPFENLRYVHSVSLETAAGLPVAPRPSQPRGCPDHPLRGMGFKFGPFSDVTKPGVAETAIGALVQLIEVDPAAWWDTYERHSLSRANACAAEHATGIETAPGLTVCRPAAATSSGRPGRLPLVAIVDSRHHAGPLGQPLAILCSPNTSAGADDHVCEMSYRLDTDVGVWYEFHTSVMPLSGVIDFDRELRRRIAEAEVSDYWWPVFPTSRPRDPHQ